MTAYARVVGRSAATNKPPYTAKNCLVGSLVCKDLPGDSLARWITNCAAGSYGCVRFCPFEVASKGRPATRLVHPLLSLGPEPAMAAFVTVHGHAGDKEDDLRGAVANQVWRCPLLRGAEKQKKM